jgi:hypothetical protein
MKSKLSDLLKKVFLSSIASIVANNTATADGTPAIEHNFGKNKENEFSLSTEKDLSPKLLLKQNSNSEWAVVSHRSHRSHSSHRSHYSSTSGSSSSRSSTTRSSGSNSSGSSTSTTSRPLGISSSGSSSNSSTPARTITPTQSPSNTLGISPTGLNLGDRNLKLGMSGSDVTQLINILIKKGYLKLENGDNQVYGTYTYDETIEATLKKYQLNNGLKNDGVCGSATAYHLLHK